MLTDYVYDIQEKLLYYRIIQMVKFRKIGEDEFSGQFIFNLKLFILS